MNTDRPRSHRFFDDEEPADQTPGDALEERWNSWDTGVLRRLNPEVLEETVAPPQNPASHQGAGIPAPAPAPTPWHEDPAQHAQTFQPSVHVRSSPEERIEESPSPWQSRQAHRLAARSGTPRWQRYIESMTGIFRTDDKPERLTTATTRAQMAVSTGRRVAVLAAHGGAGATTLTAGLGMTLARIRNDTTAVIAARPDRQLLHNRLGLVSGVSAREVRDRLIAYQANPHAATLHDLAVPGCAGLFAITQADDADIVTEAAAHLSRRHAVTLLDVGTMIEHPAVSDAHAIFVTGRMSLDGVAQVHQTIHDLRKSVVPQRIHVVLIGTTTRTGVSFGVAHKLLEGGEVPISELPVDLHLATGTPVSLSLLSVPAAVALTEIAAHTLTIVTTA
ncbi:MAG: MinD/ParA family ATP-binding protein [Actinomycetota bacterium]